MTFRTRLLVIFTLAVVASVGLVELLVSNSTRQAFEGLETQRVDALVAQFQKEFDRRKEEIVLAVNGIARSEMLSTIATSADFSSYYDVAPDLASAHGLKLLELVAGDGTIISSAEWPARFGYSEEWLTHATDWHSLGAFLKREELADGVALSLVAVSTVEVGDRRLYVVGGQELDREFLSTLVLP